MELCKSCAKVWWWTRATSTRSEWRRMCSGNPSWEASDHFTETSSTPPSICNQPQIHLPATPQRTLSSRAKSSSKASKPRLTSLKTHSTCMRSSYSPCLSQPKTCHAPWRACPKWKKTCLGCCLTFAASSERIQNEFGGSSSQTSWFNSCGRGTSTLSQSS